MLFASGGHAGEHRNRAFFRPQHSRLSVEDFFSLSPLPILITDREFVILKGNEAFSDMSGISQEKLIGMKIQDFTLSAQEGRGS